MLVTGNINYDFTLGEVSIIVANNAATTNRGKKQKKTNENRKQTRVVQRTMAKREPTDGKKGK